MSSKCAPGSEPFRPTGFAISGRWRALAAVALGLLDPAAAQTVATPATAQGSLVAGASHQHEITLPADHYVDLTVQVRDLRLTSELIDPSGAILASRSPAQSPGGTATLTAITTTTGDYRVVLTAEPGPASTGPTSTGPTSTVAVGTFTIAIETLRPASAADRLDVEAEELYLAAYAAGREGTEEGRHRAVANYRQGVVLFARSGSAVGEAKTRHGLASALRRLGDLEAARQELARAIPLWQSARLRTGEIDSRIALAAILKRLDRPEDALAHYRRARILAEAADDPHRLARVWHNQGSLLRDLDRLAESASAYEHALALRIAARDIRGEASTRSNLGGLYDRVGEYRRAAEQLDRALHLLETAGSTRLEAPLNNLGGVYNSLGQPARARIYFDRALELTRARGDQSAEARTLNNIGWSLQNEGASGRALEAFRGALSILEKLEDHWGQAAALTNLARTHAQSGAHATARTLLQRALVLRRQLDDRLGEAVTLTNLAESLRALNDPAGAHAAAERAHLLAHQADDPRTIAWTLLVLGRLAHDQGRLELAHRRTAAALDHIESLRSRTAGSEWRASLVAAKHAYYEELIDIQLARHEEDPAGDWQARAFATSERARARSLVDTLSAASVVRDRPVDPALVDRERRLGQQINALARQRGDAIETTIAEAALAEATLAETLAEHQLVRARLTAADPRFDALTKTATLTAGAVQELLDADSTLIELALGDRQSAIWLIDRQQVRAARLPPRATIEEASRNLWNLLTARNTRLEGESLEDRRRRIARADGDARDAAITLGKMLLAPVAEHLHGRRLIVATDGVLAYIPLAILHNPATRRPLIDDYEIVLVPSASALAAIRRDTAHGVDSLLPVTVMANPAFGSPAAQPSPSPDAGLLPAPMRAAADGGFASLPWTAREAETIAALTGDQARLILGTDASRARVIAGGLAGARIVHLATHGVLDSEHPELSALVLSTVDADGNPVDGYLRLHDIYNLKLDAELVVLSACQTALGPSLRGEGLIGLARGFMHAGASSVLASLWQVRDDTSADLMRTLYQRLLAGESPSSALRAAQLTLRERFAAPFFWAGFVLQGDWR